MQLTIARKPLLHLLARCAAVADRKSTMPVLANVLLTADEATLTIAATDLQLAISGSVDATVKTSGAIALPARDFLDRVRAMPDGEITIVTTDADVATIKAVGSARRYTMSGLPGDEFPALPKPDEDAKALEIPAGTLSALIAQTSFACSTDETRQQLNAMLLEVRPAHLRAVATDGHRLAISDRAVADVEGQRDILIPLKGVVEIKRLLDEDEGSLVSLTQSGPNLFVGADGIRLAVKLPDAVFPPYQQVVPGESKLTVTAPRLALADAIKSVAVAAGERTGGVRLAFGAESLRVEAESPEHGEGFDEVPITGGQKRNSVIGACAKYLLDAVLAVEGDDVAIGVSGELDPIVAKPAGVSSGGAFLGVVMPMRV